VVVLSQPRPSPCIEIKAMAIAKAIKDFLLQAIVAFNPFIRN
jgi:hypothetical protein